MNMMTPCVADLALLLIVVLPASTLARTVDLTTEPPTATSASTLNLMTADKLGDFEDESWSGYVCDFASWATCVNRTASCESPHATCAACGISCSETAQSRAFHFAAGGIYPVTEQFTLPPNTAVVGAANPNNPLDKAQQQVDVAAQTWFIVPKNVTLCGDDPLCQDASAKAPTACSGDPITHRQGFLMSSGSTLQDINFQGADLGRAASEGTLCGPGAIELPGCLDADGCASWEADKATGTGVVSDVVIRNVRLSDAVRRAQISQMGGDCATGEALDPDGGHVRAHQISLWVAKLPRSETGHHSNVLVDNLVSMNSRADGFNVHGAVRGLTLQHSHLENSGDDCVGVWSAGIANMTIRSVVAKNCAVTAGQQTNWGSCMGTYAFASLAVDGLTCYDPFLSTDRCNPRTHYTAMHINKAFSADCMPLGATLDLSDVRYFASARPTEPLARPVCGQCKSCCGKCSEAGFDDLTVRYLDGSVPAGQCMSANAGC